MCYVLNSESPKNNFDETDFVEGKYRNWIWNDTEEDVFVMHQEVFDRESDSFHTVSTRKIARPINFETDYRFVQDDDCSNLRDIYFL